MLHLFSWNLEDSLRKSSSVLIQDPCCWCLPWSQLTRHCIKFSKIQIELETVGQFGQFMKGEKELCDYIISLSVVTLVTIDSTCMEL